MDGLEHLYVWPQGRFRSWAASTLWHEVKDERRMGIGRGGDDRVSDARSGKGGGQVGVGQYPEVQYLRSTTILTLYHHPCLVFPPSLSLPQGSYHHQSRCSHHCCGVWTCSNSQAKHSLAASHACL